MTDRPRPENEIVVPLAPFFNAIGRATARWQGVEAGMFVLTHALLQTEYRYTSAVFFHIKSADSKAQLLDRLCRIYFDESVVETEWIPLYKEMDAAVRARNRIAHYEANLILDPSVLKPGEPPIALTPHHLDHRQHSQESIEAATTSTLLQLSESFRRLTESLLHFSARHFSDKELRATHLPPRLLRYLESIRNAPQSPEPPPQSSAAMPNRKARRQAERDKRR